MTGIRKTLSIGAAVGCLTLGLLGNAFAQGATGGGGGPTAGTGSVGARGMVVIQGEIVCAHCTLVEARNTYPDQNNLYEFRHEEGKVVMEVMSVNNTANEPLDSELAGRWADIAEPPQLAVRAEDQVWEKLLAKENLKKEVQLTGILRPSRTLDVKKIVIAQ